MPIPPVSPSSECCAQSHCSCFPLKQRENGQNTLLSIACPPCHTRIYSFFQSIWNFLTSLFFCFEKQDDLEETKIIIGKKEYTLKGLSHRMKTSLQYSADQTVKYSPGKMMRCIPYQTTTILEVTQRDFIDRACEEKDVALIFHTPTRELQVKGDIYIRSGLSFAHEPRPEGRGMIWKGLRTPPKCNFELPGPKGPGFPFLDEKKKDLFPLGKETVLFSPLVPIFRHRQGQSYALMEAMQKISIVTSIESSVKQRIWSEPRPEGRGMIWKGLRTPPKCSFELPGPKGPGFPFLDECKTVVFAVRGNVSPYLYIEILQNFFPGTFEKVIFVILDERNYATYANATKKCHEQIIVE